VADLIFAFDAALDRPLVVSEDAPPAVAEAISRAPAEAFAAAVAAARGRAAALVLCGRVLDASRASPAQGAMLRRAVIDLAAAGCRTIVVAESTGACHDLARLLGEPAGLGFVTPLSPLELDVRGARVEIVSAHGPLAASPVDQPGERAAVRRRIIVGSDRAGWQSGRWQDAAGEPDPFSVGPHGAAWAIPGATWVWGTRGAQPLPPGVEPLPPLQARSDREPRPGACLGLVLTDRAAEEIGPGDSWQAAAPRIDWRGGWREFPTHRVSWRTIAVDSPAGGDEELATTIWAALERLTPAADGPLEVVRCAVACGTSVARRVRVAEISAETLALVRKLGDPAAFRIWLCEVYADPTESLAALGHARSGGRPGTTTSFASALADIVVSLEHAAAPPVPGDLAREAGWLALELLESP
jgi:hypothetical protein